MKEHFFDVHHQCKVRCLAASGHRLTQIGIPNDGGPPADPQRLAFSRHEKDEADPWIFQDVRERVGAAIPGPIGDGQRLVIEDAYETRRIAFR